MNYKSFSATAQGASHKKHGKGCEDYSTDYFKPWEKLALAVVADGHGAEECCRSGTGAKFAAEIAKKAVFEFAKTAKPVNKEELEKQLRALVKNIIAEWRGKVEADIAQNPFNEAETALLAGQKREDAAQAAAFAAACAAACAAAYGTTLIVCAITANYWFGIHIGDGRFTALYRDGTFDQPVPWDKKCFLNVTTSICDDDAGERARIYAAFKNKFPAVVFLCSDGVDDNYPEYENEKHLFKLYRTIALTFAEEGFPSTCAQLKDLAVSFASNGKCDDTSIAGIIDMDAVKKTAAVWKKQIEEEKAKKPVSKPAKKVTSKTPAALPSAAQKTAKINIFDLLRYGKFIKNYESKQIVVHKVDKEV